MGLPFNDYRTGAVSQPPESIKMSTSEKDHSDYLEICAEELHEAMKSGNIKGIADSLRAAFEILDSEPHVEGEHIDE
jgi:hypothetical protein